MRGRVLGCRTVGAPTMHRFARYLGGTRGAVIFKCQQAVCVLIEFFHGFSRDRSMRSHPAPGFHALAVV